MPKIHELPPLVDTPEEADVLPFDDDSVSDPSSPSKTKKITLEQMRDWMLDQFAVGNNLLMNGNFDVWQRQVTFTPNDDTYIADRWNCLQEANTSWTFARDTAVPTSGSKYSLKCSNSTANNQCGIVQILEAKDAEQLAGQLVSLSFYAKTVSSEISNLRCAVLSWSSTEDVVTSDVVSAWGQNGTNPTWATNWTMENTPVNLALTNSFQLFTAENILIDTASMKNIAVVIWVDDGTITSGDDFWITQVQLNIGGTAAAFAPRPHAQEVALCQRYYEKSYNDTDYAGTVTGLDRGIIEMCMVNGAVGYQPFRVRKRVAPSVQSYDPIGGAGVIGTEGSNNGQSRTLDNIGNAGYKVFKASINRGSWHWIADAEL